MLARCRIPGQIRLLSTATQSLSETARIQLQDGNPHSQSLIDVATLSRPTLAELAKLPSHSFVIYPRFLSLDEQSVLLKSALLKLGGKRRRKTQASNATTTRSPSIYPLQSLFGRDNDYNFEEVNINLSNIFKAKRNTGNNHTVQYNTEASGSMIAGVSLGDARVLRMSRDGETFDVMLETGSVYVQRDDVRYGWKHEIPNAATFRGQIVGNSGQRLSVMFRDKRISK
ncbi:2OG-Fe(II) oxygenase family protein [Ceratobasidium sp. AG-Ba]|nr:2OG-Fe(II) oxygenase family protein [Ceratobasidium sp. AG-Ba]